MYRIYLIVILFLLSQGWEYTCFIYPEVPDEETQSHQRSRGEQVTHDTLKRQFLIKLKIDLKIFTVLFGCCGV